MPPTKIKLVFGNWYERVEVDGERLDPSESQRVWNHSPDGFAWGYGGSGPAQLALAILLKVTGDERVSVSLHQQFKFEHVATWPQLASQEFDVPVMDWVEERKAKDDEGGEWVYVGDSPVPDVPTFEGGWTNVSQVETV